MIYIRKNSTNNVVLTLAENSRLISPHYLFVFYPEYNLEALPIVFTANDISSYTGRYNFFKILESNAGSTTGGINVALKLTSGQYRYEVYESVNVESKIEDTTGRIVEKGRMVVSGTDYVESTLVDSVYE